MKTRQDLETPDIQFHVQPLSAENPGEGADKFSAFTMSVCQLRPESRGEIRLKVPSRATIRKSSPITCPPNRLPHHRRRREHRAHDRTPRAADLKNLRGIPADASLDMDDYDATLDWARNNTASIYHPTGTCKMGSGPEAVVDHQLRVHGIAGLRVADCSIMPEIVSGNTNAPAIMIGEKLSDLILNR